MPFAAGCWRSQLSHYLPLDWAPNDIGRRKIESLPIPPLFRETQCTYPSWLLFCCCSSIVYISIVHTRTNTHTHTRCFLWFTGTFHRRNGFYTVQTVCALLPYTYPTPKLSPHRRRCISIFPQKNSLCMIYKRFKLWGHWKCPHKSPSPCKTYVIPMSLYKCVSS